MMVKCLLGILLCSILATSSARAQSGAAWPMLSEPPKVGGGERDAAVVAAIERYAFVAPVPGARLNAVDWYNYLVQGRGTPLEAVKLLRDEAVTKEKLLRFVAEAAAKVKEGGTLWFIFVGHGAPSKDGKDAALVGVDAQQDADSLYERSIRRSELMGILSSSKAARVVAVLDTCFSGRTPGGKPIIAGLQPLIVAGPPAGLDRRVVLLTAAQGNEFAGPLPGADRPAFSYLLLGGLRGWADSKEYGGDGDGQVTARELQGYSRQAMVSLLTDRTQTPTLEGDGGARLGPAREKGPNLAVMVVRTSAAAAPAPEGSAAGGTVSLAQKATPSTYSVTPQLGPSIIYSYGETRTVFGMFADVDLYVSGAFSFGAMVNLGFGSGLVNVDVGPELKWKFPLGATGAHQPYVRVAFPFRFFSISSTDQQTLETVSNTYLGAGAAYFGFGYRYFFSRAVGIGIDLGFIPTLLFYGPAIADVDFAFTFNIGFGVEVRL
jgi:hypothetical protein